MADSKKNLYLFTSTFPYGSSEVFIKYEIGILSQKFKTVFILPSAVPAEVTKFDLPNNCNVIDIEKIELTPIIKVTTIVKSLLPALGILFNELFFSRQKKLASKNIKNNFYQLMALFLRAEKLKKKIVDRTDVFYTYWFSHEATMLGILKKDKSINKFVTRAHGFDLYEDNGKENYLAFREFQLKQVDLVYCVSKVGSDYLCNIYPEYEHKINWSHLGTDNNGINPFNKNDLVIVTCSNIVPVKRLDLLIGALRKVSVNVKWFHFGDGYLKDLIQKMITELPKNIVVEMKGKIENSELHLFYKNTPVSIFVNTSVSEGIPVSIMEAISYGIPVIATNVGGVSEIVTEETGILIEKDFQSEELSKMINTILSSKINTVDFRTGVRNFYYRTFFGEKNYNAFIEQVLAINN